MSKQQQFLAMVQTTFLANAINLSLEPNARERRAEFSATAAIGFMDEAVRAAERIPPSMSATDAAHEFVGFMLDSLRVDNATVPLWFAR